MTDVLETACELIRRRSLTPEDAGCQRWIADRLQHCGFKAEWFEIGDVTNVLLTHGRGSPSLWFLGHTDVVPSGPLDDWSSDPFTPEVRDGILYGRGASDMKGAVAAMVTALEKMALEHPNHSGQMGLLLTSDEEGIAVHGVRAVADILRERGVVPDHCLVGEPSSRRQFGDCVRIGRRGSNAVRIEINGIQGHTAFPRTIDNPVHRLAPFLTELTTCTWDEGDEQFPPSHCQVSNINAGTGAENVTPGKVTVMFSMRNGPASPSAVLKQRVREMLNRHDVTDYHMDWRVSGEPFISSAGKLRSALSEALAAQLDVDTQFNTGGGTSDGRFIAPLGSEVVELGLLNTTIHQVDESTPVDDLYALEGIYLDVCRRLLQP